MISLRYIIPAVMSSGGCDLSEVHHSSCDVIRGCDLSVRYIIPAVMSSGGVSLRYIIHMMSSGGVISLSFQL